MSKYSAQNMNDTPDKYKGVVFWLVFIFCTLLANAYPNHLEPVLGFAEGVHRSLISEKDPRLWMFVLPQKNTQYAVILNERVERDGNDEVKARQWVLEYARLKKKIPTRKLSTSETEELVSSRELEQYHLVVTGKFAAKIKEAWLGVLKQTRYPEKRIIAWNGTAYVFYYRRDRYGAYYGQTTSLKTGQPAMLVELGLKLGSLAKSEEKDREFVQKQCLDLASQIIGRGEKINQPH